MSKGTRIFLSMITTFILSFILIFVIDFENKLFEGIGITIIIFVSVMAFSTFSKKDK